MDLHAFRVFLDKHRGLVLAGVIVFILCAFGYSLLNKYRATSKNLAIKKGELARFGTLATEYIEKKAAADSMDRKARARPVGDGSTISEVERLGSKVGVKELITSIKPIEESQTGGYIEKIMEVRIEKIDLNRLVNLLYLIENNKQLIVVKEFSMKSRFEDSNLLDVSLKIAHLTRPPL